MELCDLLISDVDFDGGAVLVRDGKGGKSRTVPFSAYTKKALFQYLKEGSRDVHQSLFLADGAGGAARFLECVESCLACVFRAVFEQNGEIAIAVERRILIHQINGA